MNTNKYKLPKAPMKTPRDLGYAMPAEWEPHAATWIAWPHYAVEWPGKFAPIPWIYAELVRLISAGERVRILVQNTVARGKVENILQRAAVNLAQVDFYVQTTDRAWIRDSGPIFVRQNPEARNSKPVENGLAIIDWRFNAWAKYPNWHNDDKIPAFVAKKLKLQSWQPHAVGSSPGAPGQRFVLEGGSIDVNGVGSLLTTEECLLSPIQQRNPGLPREQIEATLCAYLGVQQILWLDCGIAGDDDTHGHIDDTARFVNVNTIVTCVEPDHADVNHAPMAENLRRLRAMRNPAGQPFTIIDLPMPAPVIFDGKRLPASYANFYIANAAVLVPVFNDRNDVRALNILAQCFPDRPVVPIYCRDLVLGLGALHCITQQEPRS